MHYARLRRIGNVGNAQRLTRRKYKQSKCCVKDCHRGGQFLLGTALRIMLGFADMAKPALLS